MPVTRHGTERPREPSLQLCIDFELRMCRIVGTTLKPVALAVVESVGEIPTFFDLESNPLRGRHCMVGSLTRVVASQIVTEALKVP